MAGEMIEFGAPVSDGGKAAGYLSRPDGNANGKGVIVIQEWWGLVPHIKDVTDRFAALGYVALAPDLYDGNYTTKGDEAGRMLMALDIDATARKLRGAAAALHAHGAPGKLGIIGFCMGGILAVYAAGDSPDDYGAVMDFYGIHPNVHPAYDRITAPVMVVIGGKDDSVPPAQGRKIKDAVEAAGGRAELHVYEDAGHAFFNDARPEAYHAASAADVWGKVQAFLKENL